MVGKLLLVLFALLTGLCAIGTCGSESPSQTAAVNSRENAQRACMRPCMMRKGEETKPRIIARMNLGWSPTDADLEALVERSRQECVLECRLMTK
ncbi:MAG TPA: hypothetical protein VMY98_10290 [Anaerolineae bacterium]|nr:hypothetical protein [Anaerolineae bacterium]